MTQSSASSRRRGRAGRMFEIAVLVVIAELFFIGIAGGLAFVAVTLLGAAGL